MGHILEARASIAKSGFAAAAAAAAAASAAAAAAAAAAASAEDAAAAAVRAALHIFQKCVFAQALSTPRCVWVCNYPETIIEKTASNLQRAGALLFYEKLMCL